MANDCLVTKLKGAVNNDKLQPYGTIKVSVTKKSGTLSQDQHDLGIFGTGMTIKVNGNGYFALTYAGLNDPASRLTEYTIPSNTQNVRHMYFKNDDYDIFIDGRYDAEGKLRYFGYGNQSSAQSIFSVNLDEFAYVTLMQQYIISNQNSVTGKLSSAVKPNLAKFSIGRESNVEGRLMDFAECTSLDTLHLPSLSQKDDIISFVNAQIAAGRATCTNLSMYNPGLCAIFGSNSIVNEGFMYLSWTSASHVTLISNNYAYAKGATAEEIAEWEGQGKTVITI